MATTILAVDDSVTMRRILEITFAGTDFQLVAVGSSEEALAKARGGGVGVIICDNSLEGDGYEVATQLKSAAGAPVLFLSSRQNPYDAGKGSAARVDDHIDKPFDTQQLIDRVTKLATGGVGIAASAPAPVAAPPPVPVSTAAQPKSRTIAYGAAPVQSASVPSASAKSAGFGAGGLGAKPAPVAPPPAARPANLSTQPGVSAQAPARAAAPAAAASAAIGAANGQLASKIGEMGLNPQQADAILALSRDLIERVVWEVVPVLAESLIREEIQRLTK